jgi:hypothetical protein
MSPAKKIVRQGIAAGGAKQQEFFSLAERLRNATDTKEAKRLGDKFGRTIFGG